MLEYLVVNMPEKTNNEDSPTYPYSSKGLQTYLNEMAAEGWVLVSYDWSSWKNLIFSRPLEEAKPKCTCGSIINDENGVIQFELGH